MEGEDVADDVQPRHMRDWVEDRGQEAHRGERVEVGRKRATDEKAQSEELRPEENRQAADALHEHDSK